MRTMKKLFALMTALSLCAAFAACGKKSEDNSVPDIPAVEDNSSLSAEVEDDTTAEETEAEDEAYVDPINPYNLYTPEQMEMLGLSYDEEGNVIDAGGRIRVSINGDSDDNSGEEAEAETSSSVYSPTKEIQNSVFGDGLIQIGDDVFQQGGYMTINEFIEQYGDRYDTSAIPENGTIDEEGWHFEYRVKNENNMEIWLFCTEPASESNLIDDAVIISFTPGSDHLPEGEKTYDNTWFPYGIKYGEISESLSTTDDVVSLCKKEGLVSTESELITPVDETFVFEDFAGKYTFVSHSTLEDLHYILAFSQLSEPNLYGYKPIVSYYLGYNEDAQKVTGLYYWYIGYNKDRGQAVSSFDIGSGLKTKTN